MAMQQWELSQYQYAAEQMCQRLNENPHEPNNAGEPRWMHYAVQMHELRLMVEVMRQSGIPL